MDIPFIFPALRNGRVHLGVSGSVAAYKSLELLRAFLRQDIHTSATLSAAASAFVSPLSFTSLGASPVFPEMFSAEETPYDHLVPGQVSDVFVVAPASANTIAKLANGIADTMLTAQALAFDKPLVIAPAMNPKMWLNQATADNVAKLAERGHVLVLPGCGTVACGEHGIGKLAPLEDIYWQVLRMLVAARGQNDFQGKKVMITLGPTREQWDGVRFWSNLSTGRMGVALAMAAWLRGASVYAVSGPVSYSMPPMISQYPVISANDMYETANSLWADMDYGIFTAAVADFSPKPFGTEKFKKESSVSGFSVEFIPNKDILGTLGPLKNSHQRVMGFAAETSEVEKHARLKLKRKHADIIVGNTVGVEGSGFGSATNDVFIAKSNGDLSLPRMDKCALAWVLLDELCVV